MDKNSFLIEDLPHCYAEDVYGGTAGRIWYALADDFAKMNLPIQDGFANYKVVKKEDIILRKGAYLRYIDVFIESGALQEKTKGQVRKQKLVSEFRFSILGFLPKKLGFVSKTKNCPLVFFIPDNNGLTWMFGTKKNGAFLAQSEAETRNKFDDDSIVNLHYVANSELYVYEQKIKAQEDIGGFSAGFHSGFRI